MTDQICVLVSRLAPGRRRGSGQAQLGRDADMVSAVSMMLRSLLPGRVVCEGRELVNVVAAP